MRWTRCLKISFSPIPRRPRMMAEFIQQRIRDIDRLMNDVTFAFLASIRHAQYDHPSVGEWTQDRYYGMKSFFNRTFENGGFVGEKSYGKVVYKTSLGESRGPSISGWIAYRRTAFRGAKLNERRRKGFWTSLKEKKPVPPPAFSRRWCWSRPACILSGSIIFQGPL